MRLLDLFRRKAVETRSDDMGYTATIIAARASYLAGTSGLAEATAVAQSCVALWEAAFASADVDGTDLLDRRTMALLARSLAFRGEAVMVIRPDRLVFASDWDTATRDGRPVAYRVSIPEVGGGRTETLLAAEVLHVVIGSDPVAPWSGTPPLRRAALSAQLLDSLESALRDTFRDSPIGSQTLPLPALSLEQFSAYENSFTGRRGATLLFMTDASGEMIKAPTGGQLTPNLADAETVEHLATARDAISQAFGVLPAMHNPQSAGPVIREAQRHLATWTLQPLAELVAEEASRKLGATITIDVHRALQSFDAGGSARAVAQIIGALAQAKEAGLTDAQVAAAFGAMDWQEAKG
jgi:hypothetical protein